MAKSTICFKSNLQSVMGSIEFDFSFLSKVREPKALEALKNKGFVLTDIQRREYGRASVRCVYAPEGDYTFGTILDSDNKECVVCRCTNTKCDFFGDCRGNEQFNYCELNDRNDNPKSYAKLNHIDDCIEESENNSLKKSTHKKTLRVELDQENGFDIVVESEAEEESDELASENVKNPPRVVEPYPPIDTFIKLEYGVDIGYIIEENLELHGLKHNFISHKKMDDWKVVIAPERLKIEEAPLSIYACRKTLNCIIKKEENSSLISRQSLSDTYQDMVKSRDFGRIKSDGYYAIKEAYAISLALARFSLRNEIQSNPVSELQNVCEYSNMINTSYISYGTVVTLYDYIDDCYDTFVIGSDLDKKYLTNERIISYSSSFGKALYGLKKGDRLSVNFGLPEAHACEISDISVCKDMY